MKSANASSPRAKRKGDNPNVIPLINKICRAENNPFSKVVAERERGRVVDTKVVRIQVRYIFARDDSKTTQTMGQIQRTHRYKPFANSTL